MPNPQEIVAIAKAAESGLAKMAPNLAEKLMADLPAIFGGRGMQVAERLAHAPTEALPVAQIAEAYQANLARFGLPKEATLKDLFTEVRLQGAEPSKLSSHRGFRNSSSSAEFTLSDGSILRTRGSGTRHGMESTTEFLTPGNETRLTYFTANTRLQGRSSSWSLKSPNFSHTTNQHLF